MLNDNASRIPITVERHFRQAIPWCIITSSFNTFILNENHWIQSTHWPTLSEFEITHNLSLVDWPFALNNSYVNETRGLYKCCFEYEWISYIYRHFKKCLLLNRSMSPSPIEIFFLSLFMIAFRIEWVCNITVALIVDGDLWDYVV